MSLPSLQKAADECFTHSMAIVRTLEEHEADIEIWNRVLDNAIENATRVRDRYVEEKRYELACVARDMADYFRAMKATKDAPFRRAT